MLTTGLDAIEITRFDNWHNYSNKQLSRIFSQEEILYCLENKTKSAERFAARFAAKEALYKSLNLLLAQQVSFLWLCKNSFMKKNNSSGAPEFIVNWEAFKLKAAIKPQIAVTITHTKSTAIALVILFDF